MPRTTKEVMEGCFRGDADCMNDFHERYKKLIYFNIHFWMKDHGEHSPDDVDEIFQDVFVRLLRNNFAALQGLIDISRPTPLISIITEQCTARYFRKKWRNALRRVELDEGIVQIPDEEELTADMYHIYEEAFSSLNEDQQRVLRLLHQDKTYEEIANETGFTATNIGVIIMRAKMKVRNFIRRNYPNL